MSLTSFLAVPEVRTRFKQDFPVPLPRPITRNWEMVAPPVSARPTIIGTAFDYIVRFHLRRINWTGKGRKTWIAENALARMGGSLQDVGREICETARIRHQEFLDGKPVDDDLLSSTVLLAQLDGVFRSGGMLPASGEFTVSPEDLNDLRQLVTACDWEQWRASHLCRLNPTFGWASSLVFGADADFQLDGTLYELKTVRKVNALTENYHQLIGYSALNYLNSGPPITKLAIYFSRFALTEEWPAPDWKDARYEAFLLWFCRAATQKVDGSGLMLSDLLEDVPQTLSMRPQLEVLALELTQRRRSRRCRNASIGNHS